MEPAAGVASRVLAAATVPPPPRATAVVVSLLPSAAYLLAHGRFGAVAAMLIASVVSLGVVVVRRRRGRALGVVLPASVAILGLRTLAGAVTGSEVVYFGTGVAISAMVAVAVAATAWTSTPAAAHLMPLVVTYDHLGTDDPRYRRVAAHLTVAWAIAELVITALRGPPPAAHDRDRVPGWSNGGRVARDGCRGVPADLLHARPAGPVGAPPRVRRRSGQSRVDPGDGRRCVRFRRVRKFRLAGALRALSLDLTPDNGGVERLCRGIPQSGWASTMLRLAAPVRSPRQRGLAGARLPPVRSLVALGPVAQLG